MARAVATRGNVITVDFGRKADTLPPLTKKELALRLRRSTRWVEMRVREGMPSQMNGFRRIFNLADVEAWLESRERGTAHG